MFQLNWLRLLEKGVNHRQNSGVIEHAGFIPAKFGFLYACFFSLKAVAVKNYNKIRNR